MQLLVASGNGHKIRELRSLFSGTPFELIAPSQLGLQLDVAETGSSYENAVLKVRAYAAAGGMVAVADDSGIEVDALDGAPGIFSARFGGNGLNDEDRVSLLLARLSGTPPADRGARYRCALVAATPDGQIYSAEGTCEGSIASMPRGSNGFGYDPVFLVDGQRTMAELSDGEKNRISHRGRAVVALLDVLKSVDWASRERGRSAGEPETPGRLSHLDASGRARMVDVSAKSDTAREARARGTVKMRSETLALILAGEIGKGNVLTTAQIAGTMAAKRTHELIPLCHPLPLTGIEIALTPDPERSSIEIEARVRTTAKTGVEMEALTAVSVAGLTIYDMCKAVDRRMTIGEIHLAYKRGGKSGEIVLE